jgi:arylsulfatase A-like enzyme
MDTTAADARPLFAYLAPMNVHLLNTRHGDTASQGERYPGFYGPYASRLRQVDACFGRFISYLRERGLFDDSIVIVTSDHGDSLGERGNWGHQFWLFPEDIRVPLIVSLPSRLREAVTADLSQVAFLTDIAPTLYSLLGYEVADRGPAWGAPLFVPAHRELPSRRRQPFLVSSSYGPTFGLLRRNGRLLYIADAAAGQDYAFDLSTKPLGSPVAVTDDLRRMSHDAIRERLRTAR